MSVNELKISGSEQACGLLSFAGIHDDFGKHFRMVAVFVLLRDKPR